jgi:hypothetical protein
MKEMHVIVLFSSHMETHILWNGNKDVMNYIMSIRALVAMNII